MCYGGEQTKATKHQDLYIYVRLIPTGENMNDLDPLYVSNMLVFHSSYSFAESLYGKPVACTFTIGYFYTLELRNILRVKCFLHRPSPTLCFFLPKYRTLAGQRGQIVFQIVSSEISFCKI